VVGFERCRKFTAHDGKKDRLRVGEGREFCSRFEKETDGYFFYHLGKVGPFQINIEKETVTRLAQTGGRPPVWSAENTTRLFFGRKFIFNMRGEATPERRRRGKAWNSMFDM